MLSIIIPAYNEEECIENTVKAFNDKLKKENIKHEILVIDDHSTDKTVEILEKLNKKIKELRLIHNDYPNGFGSTIIKGLNNYKGDYVTIVMADLSDSPDDLVKFYNEIQKGYDCVFGSRFIKGGKVVDYPKFKLVLNRLGNTMIRILFFMRYNDTTNPFKLYRSRTIEGVKPLVSRDFNLEVEIPLKAIVRGYSYSVVPNTWINRDGGESKFKIKEMGGKYMLTIIYCYLERLLKIFQK